MPSYDSFWYCECNTFFFREKIKSVGEASLSLRPSAQGSDAEGLQKHAVRTAVLSWVLEKSLVGERPTDHL